MIGGKTNNRLLHGLDRDRFGVLSGALLVGLALGRFVETPVRPFSASVLGSPLGIDLSATTLMVLVMAGMAATAVESLLRSHPLARKNELFRTYHFWIVPGLLVVGLTGWLAAFEDISFWTLGLMAGAIIVPLSLAAEYAAVDPDQRDSALVGWVETLLVYLAALILFTRIYDLGARALLSGTAVLLVAALLVTRLLWYTTRRPLLATGYGIFVGLIVGLVSWGLNYLPLSPAAGGLILLVLFYALSGLVQHYLTGRLDRRVIIEYVGVAAVGLLLIWFLA
jgi:hypothetical protein